MIREFSAVDWAFDEQFRVTQPHPLGDCELVNISMGLKLLELTLASHNGFLRSEGPKLDQSVFKIVCEEPDFLTFESDHLQNVVEDVFIFGKKDQERARQMRSFEGTELYPRHYAGSANWFIFITPIAGVTLFVAAQSVQFFELQ